MPMVLTQLYLEESQKKALAKLAKQTGRKPAELVRDAVDTLLLGVTHDELQQLDVATRKAEADIRNMVSTLADNRREDQAFLTQLRKLRAAK
jgi:hypothetical protein